MGPHDRAPEARLLRARQLAANWETTRPVHAQEDQVVWRYAKFIRGLDGLSDLEEERYLAVHRQYHEFHSLVSPGRELRGFGFGPEGSRAERVGPVQRDRGLIKALVVANAPPEYIAYLTDYAPVTIEMFEYLAWDVRRRLHARAWLHNNVLGGGGVWAEVASSDFEGMCVHMAYTAGLGGVERLLGLTQVECEKEAEAFKHMFQNSLARKALVASTTTAYNSHTAPELMGAYLQWHKDQSASKKAELAARATAGSGDELAQRLLSVLQVPSFTVAKTTVEWEGEAEEQRCSTVFTKALDATPLAEPLEVTR